MEPHQTHSRSSSHSRPPHLNHESSQSSTNHAQSHQPATYPTFVSDSSATGAYPSSTFSNSFVPDNQYLDPNNSFNSFDQSFDPSTSFGASSGGQDLLQSNLHAQDIQSFQYNQGDQLSPHSLAVDTNSGATGFPNFDFNDKISTDQSLDPSLLNFDTNQLSQQSTLNPTNLSLDPMTTLQQNHAHTPPHLLRPGMRRMSQTPSPHGTPSPQHQNINQLGRPRNMSESLDPASAAYPQGYVGNEWGAGAAFRSHRRTPSDTISEISSHSAQASPYMASLDTFDSNAHVSPMLNPQQDIPLFNDGLGLNQFSLSDPSLLQHTQVSPGHSPGVSPHLPPQQHSLPEFTQQDNYGMTGMNGQFGGQTSDGYDMFPGMSTEGFPNLNTNQGMSGEADTMSPPEINIDFAPPSRQPSFEPNQQPFGDALSPPEYSVRRKRAKSDSFAGSRPSTPNVPARGRSPSLQPNVNGIHNSLSPAGIRLPPSRSPSPALGRGRSASASSETQRSYLIDLANPERSAASTGGDPKRQKHPATFQCTLCPKRFTRAYNLRSHLRTHTDERPFVCTVCGKAFARQHDRKRHEGLHSGEKKFVCRGELKSKQHWGCGRRFARADALGRHFRSEAGRICIKPLLDEEAAERQKNWLEEQAQHQIQSQQGFVAPGPVMPQPQLDPVLPAALLQMYPEFANLNWGQMDTGVGQGGMDDDFTGNNSFDASSGAEWDISENEMSDYGPTGPVMGQQLHQPHAQHQQQQFAASGGAWNSGDYLSDFEGR